MATANLTDFNLSSDFSVTWEEMETLKKLNELVIFPENNVKFSNFCFGSRENEITKVENACDPTPDQVSLFDASIGNEKSEAMPDGPKLTLSKCKNISILPSLDPGESLNVHLPTAKKIVDEQSLLSTFCFKMSRIWDAKHCTRPDPVAAPRRPGEFPRSFKGLEHPIWRRDEDVFTDEYKDGPSPPCFGYCLPFSVSAEETEKQTDCDKYMVDSGLDEYHATLLGKDENNENLILSTLEDFSKEMKSLVDDICCITRQIEESISCDPVSKTSDKEILIDEGRREIPIDTMDLSASEHPLLTQGEEDRDDFTDIVVDLPPIRNYTDGQYYCDEFPHSGFWCFPNHWSPYPAVQVHQPSNDYSLFQRFIPVPCSIWCDNDIEAHASALHSHEACEKRRYETCQSEIQHLNTPEISMSPNEPCKTVEEASEDPTDNPDTLVWLQDESNTAYATVIPESSSQQSEVADVNSDNRVYDKTEIFLSSLYLPEKDLLPVGISIIPEKVIKKGHCSCCLNGKCDCTRSSRSSSDYSDESFADGASVESKAEAGNEENGQNTEEVDMQEYDQKYSSWVPLPAPTQKSMDTLRVGDSRAAHMKRNIRTSRPCHSKLLPDIRTHSLHKFSASARTVFMTY